MSQDQMITIEPPDKGCFTLPDGDCIGKDCMHTAPSPKLLYSVSAKDFEHNGKELVHPASGARGNNFFALLKTPEWFAWHVAEISRSLGAPPDPEQVVTCYIEQDLVVKAWQSAQP